jgi:hypothetical protein
VEILVAYATRHGATRGIADRIAAVLDARGCHATALDVDTAVDASGYDAFVVGSALYLGQWRKEAREFVRDNSTTLRARPTWLFSSGPLLDFRINGRLPGDAIQLPENGGEVTLEGEIRSTTPLTKAVIWHNGKAWKEIALTGERLAAKFREQTTLTASGWFSLEVEGAAPEGADGAFPQAATNAIRVYVGGQKIRNRESAEYFARWIDKLQDLTAKSHGWRSQLEKDRVFAQLAEARRVYERLAAEAPSSPR